MTEANRAHCEEVFADKAFVESLLEMESAEEVQAALKEKELDLSLEEIAQIRDRVAAGGNADDELSLDELEDVSGGFIGVAILIVGLIIAATIAAPVMNKITDRRW